MHIVLGNGLVVEDVEIQGLPLEAGSNNTASGRVDVGPDLECPALPGAGKERREMKLEKAIEILQEKQRENEPHWERGDRAALSLGIEALKSVKQDRVLRLEGRLHPLPGETEE